MIPINELRINNYVYYNNEHNEIGIITKLITDIITDINYVGINNRIDVHYLNKHINPIPLTEEWLLNFGYWKLDNKDIHFVTKGHTIWKCDNLFMCDKNGLIIKSVHQLQNLYFALTKEELTLNNK